MATPAPTTTPAGMKMGDMIKYNDMAAAAVGAGFSSLYACGSPAMAAGSAFMTSIAARLVSDWALKGKLNGLSDNGKNQLVVALIAGLMGYYRKQNPWKQAVSGVSIDLIAEEILKMLKIDDIALFSS